MSASDLPRPTMNRRDLALGIAATGVRTGAAAGRVVLLPVRVAARAPLVGGPLRRAARTFEHRGFLVRADARARLEETAGEALAAPEVERAVDGLLAGPLTDAVTRSLVQHRVVKRVAAEVVAMLAGPLTDAVTRSLVQHRVVERVARGVATTDLDEVIGTLLDHEVTERVVDRALESPGLERLVVRVLESRLVDEVTERVLRSPEMERVVEHIATSPQVVAAVTQHTQSLAEEMVSDVRRRTQSVDDIAERTVRGWLRRPRPQTP